MSNEQPTASGGSELPDELARWAQPLGVPGAKFIPAWLRPHRGEQRWSVLAVIVLVIGLQLALPDKFVLRPRTAAPSIEAALSLVLVSVLALTNAVSTALLVHVIVSDVKVSADKLLASGAAIWLANVIAFALWYWEFDRGGPGARAAGGS